MNLPSRTQTKNPRARNNNSLVIALLLLVLIPCLFSLQTQAQRTGETFSPSLTVRGQLSPTQLREWQRYEAQHRKTSFEEHLRLSKKLP